MKITDIYQNRRDKLFSKLKDNSIAILATNTKKQRSGDTYYPFRGHSNFLYLTNFNEADTILLLSKQNNKTEFILFLQEIDEKNIIWDSDRLGTTSAIKQLNADKAYNIDDFNDKIIAIIPNFANVYYDFGIRDNIDKKITKAINFNTIKPSHNSLQEILNEMRLIKDNDEIKAMKLAASITKEAFVQAMKQTIQSIKNTQYEYEIGAIFNNIFAKHNIEHAYLPIVAGGKNACTLHYIANNKKLINGDLLLIDAGAEYKYYASDITRTFPINGSFNSEQKALYKIVLDAQKQAINSIKIGICIDIPHKITTRVITDGLRKLGLLAKNSTNNDLKQFFMHNTGHWLGLDVHDVGDYKINNSYRSFVKGMIMTVEPGIYIRENPNIDKKWWNIGIRIEDDVLVTDNGNEVLSKDIIKEVDEIEQLMTLCK